MIPDFILNPNPELYLSDNYCVLDFETTNIDKGDPTNETNSIVCANVQFWEGDSYREYKYAGKFGKSLEKLLEIIQSHDFVVSHNAKFEQGWLKRLGFPIHEKLWFCTQIAEYVLLGNHRRHKGIGLDACLSRYGIPNKGKIISAMMSAGVCPSEMPESWLEKYCKQDVRSTHELFLKQRDILFKTKQEKIFYTKCLQTAVLVDIESKGMQLDTERVEKLYKERSNELGQAEAELNEITGGINPRSPKQMSEFLYDTLGFDELKDRRGNPIRTNSGQRGTSQEIISGLKATNRLQRKFLEVKKRQGKLNGQVTKYLEKFKECCINDSGLLLGIINQCITKTGRYSSTGKKYKAQFQNFDRTFKPLFTTRNDGWLLGEADEAQLEFRTAVFFGQDSQGFEDIHNDFDVHQYTAGIIGCSRQDAKPHTFKPLYGGISGTPNEVKYYQAFREKYSDITEVQDGWVDYALEHKEIVLPTGQKFYFPDIRITRSGYVEHNTNVRNYPVQYLATAEIVPIALVFAWYLLKDNNLESFIVNTVHDSIICEVHPEEVDVWKEVMKDALEQRCITYMKQLYDIDFNIPLEAECKAGSHWSEPKDGFVI